MDRSAEPSDARTNGSTAKNSDSASLFSNVVGLEEVSREVADVDTSKRMNFASYPIFGQTPKFVDLWISTVNTADKLDSVFAPLTRAEGLTDHSDWLMSKHCIVEFTEGRVSEIQAYSYYNINSEFETRNVFERESIQMTRPDQNIPLTRLNQNIPMT